jgi:hypothetical protein
MTSIKEALEIVRCMIQGDQIEAAIVDTDTMASLGDVVRAALAQLDSADAVAWQYRDDRWDDDRWHVCAERPRDTKGRRIRALFTGLLPDAGPGNGAEKVREALTQFLKAWDSLPIGDHSIESVQKWLNGAELKVAVTDMRAALHSTSAAGETDIVTGAQMDAIESAAIAGKPLTEFPSEAIPADVLAMKEACKRAVSECLNQYGRMTFVAEKGWSGLEGQIRAAIDELSPEAKAEGGRGEPVAIKPLEWDKHPDEDEWFSHDHGLYDVSEYLVYKSPVSTTAWCLKVRGILLDEDFLGPDAAKAAAQSDYEARIRSALYTHPASPPDVEAIRADERERCARIADDHTPRKHEATLAAHVTGARIASAIRTGGQK